MDRIEFEQRFKDKIKKLNRKASNLIGIATFANLRGLCEEGKFFLEKYEDVENLCWRTQQLYDNFRLVFEASDEENRINTLDYLPALMDTLNWMYRRLDLEEFIRIEPLYKKRKMTKDQFEQLYTKFSRIKDDPEFQCCLEELKNTPYKS